MHWLDLVKRSLAILFALPMLPVLYGTSLQAGWHARSLQRSIDSGTAFASLTQQLEADPNWDFIVGLGRRGACKSILREELADPDWSEKIAGCSSLRIKFISTLFYSMTFEIELEDDKVKKVSDVWEADDF